MGLGEDFEPIRASLLLPVFYSSWCCSQEAHLWGEPLAYLSHVIILSCVGYTFSSSKASHYCIHYSFTNELWTSHLLVFQRYLLRVLPCQRPWYLCLSQTTKIHARAKQSSSSSGNYYVSLRSIGSYRSLASSLTIVDIEAIVQLVLSQTSTVLSTPLVNILGFFILHVVTIWTLMNHNSLIRHP